MSHVQAQITQQLPLPAPVGGINALDAATMMPTTDALSLVNMVSGRLGVTSRLGYENHVLGIDGGAAVQTILPYTAGSAAADRLFATTTSGIYEVTAGEAIEELIFASENDDSGWGVSTAFVTNAGHFLFYADETNGLHRYNGTDWEAVSDITFADGTTINEIVFVTVWKNRVWLVKRGTGEAYFLDTGAIAGAASRHSFGNKFRAGGHLVGLWNWTRDGGVGVDDHLVAISSAGDVLIYKGTDPANPAEFGLVGSWYIGAVPVGRRIATDFGGDLLVLSLLGVVPLSRIITGTFEVAQAAFVTQKIQPLFNRYVTSRGGLRGWSLRLHPEDNALLVNMPLVGPHHEQLAMSLANGSWSLLTGVPSLSSEVWRGRLYFGTADGRVCLSTGGTDDGAPIQWSGQTSFQAGAALVRKRVQMIQPLVAYQGPRPGIEVRARYDFDMAPVYTVAQVGARRDGEWDLSTWNMAQFGYTDAVMAPWRGATGNGFYASVVFRGVSVARATLLGFNIRLDTGGIA